jgi:hypothetical protein
MVYFSAVLLFHGKYTVTPTPCALQEWIIMATNFIRRKPVLTIFEKLYSRKIIEQSGNQEFPFIQKLDTFLQQLGPRLSTISLFTCIKYASLADLTLNAFGLTYQRCKKVKKVCGRYVLHER